jgi:predicted branched-subunit amino acid permease
MRSATTSKHSSVMAGLRAGLALGPPTFALGTSFGVLARPLMGTVAPVVMSVAVFSGAAQFASLSVLTAGGGVVTAIAAGLLMNARWLAMGVAVGPSLPGGPLARAIQGQSIVDASFAIASRGDGTFDRGLLIGATIPQVSCWIAGTVVGVLVGPVLGDPKRLGLDALFLAFYLALLWGEVSGRKSLAAALVGGAIALVLMPVAPVGLPIVAASLAALIGLVAR